MARFRKGEEVYYVNSQNKVLRGVIQKVTKLKEDVRYLFSNGQTAMADDVYDIGSDGAVNKEMLAIGISITESRKIEILFWRSYDRAQGVTPYERGFRNFVNGKSTMKYNMLP